MNEEETLTTFSVTDDLSRVLQDVQTSTLDIERSIRSLKRELKRSSMETLKEVKRLAKRVKVMEDMLLVSTHEIRGLQSTLQSFQSAQGLSGPEATNTNPVQPQNQ
jgi:hypothetical protein